MEKKISSLFSYLSSLLIIGFWLLIIGLGIAALYWDWVGNREKVKLLKEISIDLKFIITKMPSKIKRDQGNECLLRTHMLIEQYDVIVLDNKIDDAERILLNKKKKGVQACLKKYKLPYESHYDPPKPWPKPKPLSVNKDKQLSR